MGVLKSNVTLQQRLRRYIGKQVAIEAEGLSLEPGLLQSVLRSNFIRVTGELFVPLTLNQITVLNVNRSKQITRAGVTATFGGSFDDIQLILIGKDFIELQPSSTGSRQHILIPLNKVIRIFEIKG